MRGEVAFPGGHIESGETFFRALSRDFALGTI